MPHTVYTCVWVHWQMRHNVVQAREPWGKSAPFFCFHFKKHLKWQVRGFFFLSLPLVVVVLNYYSPRNVPNSKELKFLFSINYIDNPAPYDLKREGEWNALDQMLVSSLCLSLLSYKKQYRLEDISLALFLCRGVLGGGADAGLGWDVVSGLMDHVQWGAVVQKQQPAPEDLKNVYAFFQKSAWVLPLKATEMDLSCWERLSSWTMGNWCVHAYTPALQSWREVRETKTEVGLTSCWHYIRREAHP